MRNQSEERQDLEGGEKVESEEEPNKHLEEKEDEGPQVLPDSPVLLASQVYILLNTKIRVSRNVRAQWYFKNLQAPELTLRKFESVTDLRDEDLEAVGIIPETPPPDWDWDVSHLYRYRLTPRSKVQYLSQRYRLVYLLDLSPSTSSADLELEAPSIASHIAALRHSLLGCIRPFYVPGGQLLLHPEVFVTVLAWMPFLTTETQLVLHQGSMVSNDNFETFLEEIVDKVRQLEAIVATVNNVVQNDIASIRAEADRLMGGLFEEESASPPPPITTSVQVATAESGFIRLIRMGILALQMLLPKNSSVAGMIVISDGAATISDIDECDGLLSELRTKTISLSFLPSFSKPYPHVGFSRLPHWDVFEFLATCTYGTFLKSVPLLEVDEYVYDLNRYHLAFLCWSFTKEPDALDPYVDRARANICNDGYFLFESKENCIKKKMDFDLDCSINSILYCRLREGYIINRVILLSEDLIEVQLTLPWKVASNIHYVIQSKWPPPEVDPKCRIFLYLEGDYDILHDIICKKDAEFRFPCRSKVVNRFHTIVQHLTKVDMLLMHLESFQSQVENYTIPETMTHGIPVFYMPPPSLTNGPCCTPQIYQPDFPHLTFASFWKPVCSLDINIWHRWMHTHRINLLLTHDYPLPKHLLSTNPSGRYTHIQCRKSAAKLYSTLKSFANFTLMENTSYVKFLFEDKENSQVPSSFYVIRVTAKLPCVVLWLAFLGGTSGLSRHGEVTKLREHLKEMTILQQLSWKDTLRQQDSRFAPISSETTEFSSCIMTNKRVERILVRYTHMPRDFSVMLEPLPLSLIEGYHSRDSPAPSIRNHGNSRHSEFHVPPRKRIQNQTHLKLVRYLDHKRFIWSLLPAEEDLTFNMAANFVTKVLNTFLRIRLSEGFHFAHSNRGIQTLVKEIQVENFGTKDASTEFQSLLVQYVLFPPCAMMSNMSSVFFLDSDEDFGNETESSEEDPKPQIVTEVWVEPQHGTVIESEPNLGGLRYHEILPVIYHRDKEILKTLLSLEFLCSLCRESAMFNYPIYLPQPSRGLESSSRSVENIPFAVDLIPLLKRSPMSEILVSTLIQEITVEENESTGVIVRHVNGEADRPNNKLVEMFLGEMSEYFDRELHLSDEELAKFMELVKDSGSSVFPEAAASAGVGQFTSSMSKTASPSKWKCFLRSMGKSNCVVVTIVPATYQETKKVLLNHDAIEGKNLSVFYPIEKRAEAPAKHADDHRSEDSSELLMGSPVDSITSKSGSSSSAGRGRTDSLSQVRQRTKSIDNSEATLNERNRCKSMGSGHSAVNPPAGTHPGGEPPVTQEASPFSGGEQQQQQQQKKAFRPRTHTYSHFNRGRGSVSRQYSKENSIKAAVAAAAQKRKKERKIYGSLAFPMYSFEVSEHTLMRGLLEQTLVPEGNFQNLLFHPEDKVAPANSEGEEDKKEEIAQGDVPENADDLRSAEARDFSETISSCVKQAFFKSFVHILYQALQARDCVHTYDIQNAIDYCDNEKVFQTELSKFFRIVCRHSPTTSDTLTLPPDLDVSQSCSKDDYNHAVMDKKFRDVLFEAFETVPCHSDLYYFRPSANTGPLAHPKGFSRQRRDTKDTTTSSGHYEGDDFIQFRSDLAQLQSNAGKVKPAHDASSDTTGTPLPHHGSMSIVSNIVSEVSEFNDSQDDHEDVFPPLFLQVTLTAKYGAVKFESIPISKFIACYRELFAQLDEFKSTSEIDLEDLSLSIDVLCISLPVSAEEQQEKADATSLTKTATAAAKDTKGSNTTLDTIEIGTTIQPNELTETQKHAVDTLVSEIRWMVEDELTFARTRSELITCETIENVVRHVESSPNKPGCSTQAMPLGFVHGTEESFALLQNALASMKVSHLDMICVGEYYYFVQKESLYDVVLEEENSAAASIENSDVDLDATTKDENEGGDVSSPDFWLILKTTPTLACLYFQYREGQLTKVLPWRQAQSQILFQLSSILKNVNQTTLLKDLFENKFCDRLLEDDKDLGWEGDIFHQDHGDNPLEASLSLKYKPGEFACPKVWEYCFDLHPRIVQDRSSKGISSLRLAMSNFTVMNRTNLFVFQQTDKKIFYMRLFEATDEKKLAAAAAKAKEDSETSSKTSRHSSFGSMAGFTSMRSPDVSEPSAKMSKLLNNADQVILKVYGISEPGEDIKQHLVAFLQYKLDDRVTDILSNMLLRNPSNRLTPGDVDFLQPPSSQPTYIKRFGVDKVLAGCTDQLMTYLHQNLVHHSGVTLPKYADLKCQFQDFISKKTASHVFLYYSAGGKKVGNRGVATLVVTLEQKETASTPEAQLQQNLAKRREELLEFASGTDVIESKHVMLNVDIWDMGRKENENLNRLLEKALSHALWDLVTELSFVPVPCGAKKTLTSGYETESSKWLQTGCSLGAPSVAESVINLSTRFNHSGLIQEFKRALHSLVMDLDTRVYQRKENGRYVAKEKIRTNSTDETFFLVSKFIMPASTEEVLPRSISRAVEFQPYLPKASRQCMLLVFFTAEKIKLQTYNFSRACVERLVKVTNMILSWLNTRTALATTVLCQKSGIFCNQKLFRATEKPFERVSNVKNNLHQLETVVRNKLPPATWSPPRPHHGSSLSSRSKNTTVPNMRKYSSSIPSRPSNELKDKTLATPSLTEIAIASAFRDSKPAKPLSKMKASKGRSRRVDFTQRHGHQLLGMVEANKIELLGKIHQFWESKGGNASCLMTADVMSYFQQLSRVLHFCLTPLLFLPKWRYAAHATRLKCHISTGERRNARATAQDAAPEETRILRRNTLDEQNHRRLVQNFIQEYIQYVQTFGFVVINIQTVGGTLRKKLYLQKSLPGGLLLFEIGIAEPFFFTRLYSLEISRLQPKKMAVEISNNIVDECDRIKYLLHLHSFTYDYHLRTAHNFATDRRPSYLRKGYHITSFLSDFLKYYSKGPNFARNIITEGRLSFTATEKVSAAQLFGYLLSHEKNYGFKVLKMDSLYEGHDQPEYILVKQSQFTFGPPNGNSEGKNDEFDVSLIISCTKLDESNNQLHLHYTLILTNKNKLYPTFSLKDIFDGGKFAPVQAGPDGSNGAAASSLPPSVELIEEPGCIMDHVAKAEIQPELVFYVGFFSYHEQTMQRAMQFQQNKSILMIQRTLELGTRHCWRDVLWRKLLKAEEDFNLQDFRELLPMVYPNNQDHLHDLRIVNRPSGLWLKKLIQSFLDVYGGRFNNFKSMDQLKEYLVLMEDGLLTSCVMVTLDLENKDVSIMLLNQEEKQTPAEKKKGETFLENILSLILGHVWSDI